MTVENRYHNYTFSDMHDTVDDETFIAEATMNGDAIGTIFMDEGEVGEDVAHILAARVAHLSNSIEDQNEYARLHEDLETHIYENY